MKKKFYMLIFFTSFSVYTAEEPKEQQDHSPRGRTDTGSLRRRSSRSSSSPSNPVVQLIVLRKGSGERLERPSNLKRQSSGKMKRLSSGNLKRSGESNYEGKFLDEENLEVNKDGRLSPGSRKVDVTSTPNVTQLASIKENGDSSHL